MLDAECCVLDDLCGNQWECFCRASARKPPTLSGRKHRGTDPDTHKPQSVISVNRAGQCTKKGYRVSGGFCCLSYPAKKEVAVRNGEKRTVLHHCSG